ncbi:MAG: arylsulfatase A [Planctomycetota bacterium]|jgi:arylsulfatase A
MSNRICLYLLLVMGCASPPEQASPLPNILILYTDDQGYGDCGAMNPNAKFATPHIDRLAREGVVFTDGHSAGSVCTPSRYALLTGRYAWRTPLGSGVLGADADCMIEDGQTTIASLLRASGYRTALFGKWHLGMQIPGEAGRRDWDQPVLDGPLQKGFDQFYGIPASMNFGVLTWFDGDRAIEPTSMWTRKKFPTAEITTPPLDYRMAPPYEPQRQTQRDIEVASGFVDEEALRIITEHAIEFIEAPHQDPFFAMVAFTSPHLPHCTAPEFRGTSDMGNYGDFMAETDHRIGQILSALRASGHEQNTLVLMTSDNGPENNYKDWSQLYQHESAGGLRGGKRDVYEGGHRVPFFVRWPQAIQGGQRSNRPIGQVDCLATIADIVGAPLQPGQAQDSVSFAPELLKLVSGTNARKPLMHHGRGQFAIREGRWKLVFDKNRQDSRKLGQPIELYDLHSDPAETNNRRDEAPAIVYALMRRAEEILGPN